MIAQAAQTGVSSESTSHQQGCEMTLKTKKMQSFGLFFEGLGELVRTFRRLTRYMRGGKVMRGVASGGWRT